MKVLFLGTPEFAVASLDALVKSKHTVVGVVTQPDRAVKRGKIEACAVKKAALGYGLPIFQPEKVGEQVELYKQLGAEIAVTAAYGQILKKNFLDAFCRGVINVHASLLPKYRGASPIQSAIADGEKITGVTIMKTELGLDTGDILSVAQTPIKSDETYGELVIRLAEIGAKLLIETLDNFDNIVPVKQDDTLATHCRTITKQEQYIDFSQPSECVANKIRALSPSPCAKTVIGGEVYKIYRAVESVGVGAPGTILQSDNKLVIACGEGAVEVLTIQAPSKRALGIRDFLCGNRLPVGGVCGSKL